MATTDHKEGKATVRAVYYTSKVLADGSHPFLICITKDRKRKYLATGEKLHPKYWNAEKGGDFRKSIRKSYPDTYREQLITNLGEWEKKYETAAGMIARNDEQHTAADVARKAAEARKASRRVKLLAYIEELAAGMAAGGQIGNATVYRDLGNQLAKFIAAEDNTPEPPLGKGREKERAEWIRQHDIPFDRVSVGFCHEWEATLRATGAEEITLSLRFRTLRAVLNKAIANGLAKAEQYPFARNVAERHKFQVGKFDVSTSKRAITRDEVRKIEAYQPTTDRLRLAKDAFIFSFYAGGINWVDLAQLQWRNLANDTSGNLRLAYVRDKTGGKFALKLQPPAAAIINYHRPHTYAGPESFIFPVLNAATHRTKQQIKNRLHKVLGQVNKDLKLLAAEIGIDIPLTTYVARHSFATSLKRAGVATAIISESMGHASEAVTAVYLDSFASDVLDSAFENLL
ncbi:site-specific integrase [Hymenobacter sp. BT188]|uniref:site-specific integrase n=1 Tax=Hymenobacter sp. BT188 TaxID=2763504 RepID=UPI001651497E|nr:site-specific integrase [Hymenobacter sp. BT188]MBC6606260.1 site-specific integrase [Hymenobacter sp. BT188]